MLILFVFLSLSAVSSDEHHEFAHSKYLKHDFVHSRVSIAKSLLHEAHIDINSTADRLAILLLYTHSIKNTVNGPCLKYSITQFYKNIQKGGTKADIFLFVKSEWMSAIAALPWIKELSHQVFLIPIDMEQWVKPLETLRPRDKGWSDGFTIDYRLMGDWKLRYSFPFAYELGYKYMLQADSDTYVMSLVGYDLVKDMKDKGILMGNRNLFYTEPVVYHKGLPEITRYFLATRLGLDSYVTAQNASKAGIKGPLLKHCYPQDINGLRTGDPINKMGWDAQAVSGNFNLFSLDWYMSWEVQDFLNLVFETGGHIEHRWCDAVTMGMLSQLFVPEANFHVYGDIQIDHGHGNGFVKCTNEGNGQDWYLPFYDENMVTIKEFSNSHDQTPTPTDKLACLQSTDPLGSSVCKEVGGDVPTQHTFFIVPGNTTIRGSTVWWVTNFNRDQCLSVASMANGAEVKMMPMSEGRCSTDWVVEYQSHFGWYSSFSVYPRTQNLCLTIKWTAPNEKVTLRECAWGSPDYDKAKAGRLEQLFIVTRLQNGYPFGSDY